MANKKAGASERVFMQNAIKTLAANIRFASVDNPITIMELTSSVPNEGKSTIAINLAQAMAQSGKEVLLVECDMRRRSLASMMGVHARSGIYSVLSGQVELEDAVVKTSTRGMYLLDCEPHIPNPVDILSSKRFHSFISILRQRYDFVIFDTPPLSAFVDAAVLAPAVDGTLLVVRQNFVKRDELAAAYAQLQKANANIIGVAMNYCDSEKSEYYYSYYAKDGKKAPAANFDEPIAASMNAASASAPAPVKSASASASSAAAAAPSASQPAPARSRAAATQSAPAAPGLKPIPTPAAPRVAPDSTAQFLAGTSYRPRTTYVDE